jgi:hypothetical protein
MAEAPIRRLSRLTLYPQPAALEQACRREHDFASRHPAVYRWRVGLLSAALVLLPFWMLGLQVAIGLAFPWAFRESAILRPVYSEALLRWAVYGSTLHGFRSLSFALPACCAHSRCANRRPMASG